MDLGETTARHAKSALEPKEKEAKTPPQPVAVIDCGTSSVRATIAELRSDGVRVLEDIHFPVDLSASFRSEKLDRAAMDAVVEAFTGIMDTAKAYGIGRSRAVATTALREAGNSDVLVERLNQRLGVELEVIDSAEEARLYFEALRALLKRAGRKLPGITALIDVGGGSTCLSIIRAGKLAHSVDEHFGTLRLSAQFSDLKDSTDYAITVDRFSHGAVRMMLGRLPEAKIENLVVNGPEMRRLLALLAPEAKGLIEPLPVASVEQFFHKMQALTPRARGELCGCEPHQASLLLPAASFLRHLGAQVGRDQVLVPQLTLRDGLLADFMPGAHGPHHLDQETLLAEAWQLVAKYGGNLEYAGNTASLSVQIFDQCRELHGLGERERTLLEFSALVHDIGSFINVRNRHKHTQYIINAADIPGLTRDEKEMVAHIARYHRRSQPQAHHMGFQSLSRRQRVVVSHLAAIVRLSYALDVERTQRIRKLRCEVADNRLLMHVDRRQIALERWSIAGKAGMFQEVFGLEVVVVPREEE
jgi:exopolyphosphatase / guanosine-5'-triphosphate,3'-diphosphate pyrophosphatase